jgi:hypothetical protein
LYSPSFSQGKLKSVIYDFDGLDLGETDLPDGDYDNFDMSYLVVANPLTASSVLGDRVLRLNLNWSGGTGEFGKGISRYIELNAASDYFNFYIYNPLSNYAAAQAEIVIKEDDNSSLNYESASDDKWSRTVSVSRSGSWQLVSLPLSSFTDVNTGGNGIFDAGYTSDNGMVLIVGITFSKASTTMNPEHYFVDMISFSEGPLPTGSTILQAPFPSPADHCALGCLAYRSPADSVPPEVESLFSPANELSYVNIFMSYAYSGTTPVNIPGSAVQRLINNGYRPVITWESMYTAYAPLDPVQPSLTDITSGTFDTYIDAFATQIKTYSDTIVIRLFHEFDGNWYPWAVSQNGNDPLLLASAFRYIVNRFNAIGATNVLWCWCPNSSPTPSRAWNWSVLAYPGDAYVDIVATNIYNHPLTGTPPWRSFRSVLAESYYYLTDNFPGKRFFITELASRERYSGEMTSSQTKAEWLCQMSNDLQSYFSKVRAIMFFSTIKGHDWRINSSADALNAMENCIWEEEYFGAIATTTNEDVAAELSVFPNPFGDELNINVSPEFKNAVARITDMSGRIVFEEELNGNNKISPKLASGVYILSIISDDKISSCRLLKADRE